jgi:methanethiol S-methyltransferase
MPTTLDHSRMRVNQPAAGFNPEKAANHIATSTGSAFARTMVMTYGVAAYLMFFVAVLWAMGFVANVFVPKSIDSGVPGDPLMAMLVNSLLLGAFAIQHTVMARRGFKQWITRYIPEAAERSTFVMVASAILLATLYYWQPMPNVVWAVESRAAEVTINHFYWFGWCMVFFSSFLINHFDLFGLRQAYMMWSRKEYRPLVFRTTLLYRFVRHPLLLGFVIAFWSAPVMTEGRLLFAVLTTLYILVGIQFEERDLARAHGEVYRQYQKEVPMLIPYKLPVAEGEGQAAEKARPATTA